MNLAKRRLFVGNLPAEVSQSAIKKKLNRFGKVLTVETKQRTDSDGNVLSSFAFVDIEADPRNLDSCFEYFENEKWNNEKVKVQLAKESFLERLKREQNSSKTPPGNITHSSGKSEASDFILQSEECHEEVNEKISSEKTSNRRRYPSGSPLLAKKNIREFVVGKGIEDKLINSPNSFDVPSKIKGLPMFAGTKLFADLEDNIKYDRLLSVDSETSAHKSVDLSENVSKDSSKTLYKERATKEKKQKKVDRQTDTPKTEKRPQKAPLAGDFINVKDEKNKIKKRENSYDMPYRDKDDPKTRNKKSVSGTEEMNCSPESGYTRKRSTQGCPEEKVNECTPERQLIELQEVSEKEKSGRHIKKIRNINADAPQPAEKKKASISDGKGLEKAKNDMLAEQKRLNALEERRKAFVQQKDAVKKALSSIDSTTPVNKKIVFDMDDSDEENAYQKNQKFQRGIDNSKPKLFDDSSDDEELKEFESKEFKIKPQFEGPKGQKLLAIQSRYANDARFNLDERFLDSDDEGKSGQKEGEEEEGHSDEDLNAEKNRQLSILQDMLGVDVSTRKRKREEPENKSRDSLQMVRFDPTNPEHSRYLVTEEELKKKRSKKEEVVKKRKKGDVDNEDDEGSKKAKIVEEPVPIVTERFYKVTDRLKDSLKKRSEHLVASTVEDQSLEESSGGFSLLKKFGAAPVDDEKDEAEYSTKVITRNHNEWEKNPFRYDSSDEEDDKPESLGNHDEVTTKRKSPDKDLPVPKSSYEPFYFHENDPRLQEGLEFFTVKKSFSEMQEGFHERRADLKLIIRAKVRNNKRRKRPIKKKLGGARKQKKRVTKR